MVALERLQELLAPVVEMPLFEKDENDTALERVMTEAMEKDGQRINRKS